MDVWTKWMLQGVVRIGSSTVPNDLRHCSVQEQWPAENVQSFSQQHLLMLLLQAKPCTLKDVSCAPILPVVMPRHYSSNSTWLWVLLPLLLTLSGPTLLDTSQGNTETGMWGQVRIDGQTLLKNRHSGFLSFTSRIFSEVALLGETSRCCFNQL